jgi:integrase
MQSPIAAKRRPGRPAKSLDPAVAAAAFGLEQFAALRGYLGGLDPQAACSRYLTNEPRPASEGAALRRLISLLEAVATAAASRPAGTPEAEQAQRAARILRLRIGNAELRRQALLARDRLSRLRRTVRVGNLPASPSPAPEALPAGAPLPARFDSLDSFRDHYIETRLDGIDPDLGEEEWEALFMEGLVELEAARAPLAPQKMTAIAIAEATDPVRGTLPSGLVVKPDEALAALETCRWVVSRQPIASDLVDTWFTGNTVRRLKAADLPTLYSLVLLLNQRGRRWWTRVKGLGPERGQRVTDWLLSVGQEAGLKLRPDLAMPLQYSRQLQKGVQARGAGWETLSEVGLEPLALLAGHQALDGAHGAFRLATENLLGARTDLEAIAGALAKYKDKPSTLVVYSREICRFALWAYVVMRKPISSISIPDARRYKEFLDDVPSDWINPIPTPRGTYGWRPFRGQLDDASKRKALTAVHVVLQQLHAAGYLAGNPMAGVLKRAALKRPSMDVGRSFDSDQWEFILAQLDQLPSPRRLQAIERSRSTPEVKERLKAFEAASARRLKALVRLLQSTGLRRDECHRARLDAITKVLVDGQPFYTLAVVGKGGKLRDVYVPTPVLQLVLEHLQDRDQAIFADDPHTKEGRAGIPLISVLRPPLPAWQPTLDGRGAPALVARDLADPSGALGIDGMHHILKRFFTKCAVGARAAGLDASRFNAASAHWMRHTFGTMLADNDTDLRTVQKAMGHSSIQTTAHYSSKDQIKMLRELHAGMPASMRD